MKKSARIALHCLLAMVLTVPLAACGSDTKDTTPKKDMSTNTREQLAELSKSDERLTGELENKTIKWMSDWDINSDDTGKTTPIELAVFQERYGGQIEFHQTTYGARYDNLANAINSDEGIDFFYGGNWDAFPKGAVRGMFVPYDDYIDLDSDLWKDVKAANDAMVWNDKHYMAIVEVTGDQCAIIYNRKTMDENGLDDPAELFEKGKWDWDAFMDMMKTFVSNAKDGETRYGINGWFGQAMVQSTGETFVKYDGSKFSNNISNPAIEEAEGVMEEIMSLGLYDPTWYGYLPDDGSTLFFGMADWALGASNVKADPNPDYEDDGFVEENDLMIVPFPKQPGSDEYYLNCNFGAKMLVKNSDKGDAVAAYIKCERLAAMIDEYKDAAKEKAIIPEVNAQGKLKSYVTEEQYDALQDYKDPKNITPIFDFGYGMGSRMYGDGEYTYETRGVMNNLTSALLNGDKDSWAVLRDEWSSVIDEVIDGYNNK